MSKVYAGLLVAALAALMVGCQADGHGKTGCGCGCSSGCGCGDGGGCSSGCSEGCGEGCGGCSEGCGSGCGDGCGCGSGGSSSLDAERAQSLFRQYKGWKKANARPFLSKPHKRHKVIDFTNRSATATFLSGKGSYRAGAAIAKEGWKKGKRSMVWLMEKRPKGYDRKNGDWFYATLTPGGKVLNAGKVAMCVGCHEDADNDYVYGLPRSN